ncbi:hypothetical protein ACIBCO_11555 [Streptomyces violascens]|uniref:hypothetical protein n=1 Tax=Streptomyces violascens TaxID=67381 RepID=UPI0037A711FA
MTDATRFPAEREPEGRPLDDVPETERPWTPDTPDQRGRANQRFAEPELKVSVQYVVVHGPDGEALQHRQAAAVIRRVLAHLRAQHVGELPDESPEVL